MSTYGTVSTIVPPVLADTTQPALIKFETAYTAYKDKIAAVNRTRTASQQISPHSVKECVEPTLLQSMCIMGDLGDAESLEEVTDQAVQAWLDAALAMAPRDISDRVKAALDAVRYKQVKEDPAGGVTRFLYTVIQELDKNNASEVVKDSSTCKNMINKLVNKLEPPELKERVSHSRECWTNEDKSSLKIFRERVGALAVDVLQGEAARARLGRKRGHAGRSAGCKPTKVPDDRPPSLPAKKKFFKKRSDDKGDKKWTTPCLNPKCTGVHKIKDCPNTSESLKKQLLDEYHAAKRSAMKSVLGEQVEKVADADEGRFQVILEDKVDVIALGDYGSCFTAMPMSLARKVCQVVPDVSLEKTTTPMKFSLAIKDIGTMKDDFVADSTLTLDITIVLPGSNIPVRLRGVKFLVVDQNMEEVLLGRPLLRALGFDLKTHLESVARLVDGKHVEELNLDDLKSALPTESRTDHRDHGALKAMSTYQGLVYQGDTDDPIELPDPFAAGIGKDDKASIDAEFARILAEAEKQGMCKKGVSSLRNMLDDHRDIFRIKLGADPPAKVAPLRIQPIATARPYRSPQRRYAQHQREFISRTIKELKAVGAVYKNPSSKWASPALAVPKPGSSKLRFTVDLRGPNAQTVPIQPSMPHLESMLLSTEGSICFAKIDMAHAYWQLPLAKDSQEMLSIQTPLGVFSSTRLLQGSTDAGNHFQAVTQDAMQGRVTNLLQWLDDFLIYARTEADLLHELRQFFLVCEEYGFKIHAEKTDLFLKKARFCGRIISGDGVVFDPRHLEALINMKRPSSGDELQQLICATNWMRTSFPAYAEAISPLHNLMEDVYRRAGGRTKRAVKKVSLHGQWGAEHDTAFAVIIEQLSAATKLSHPKQGYDICLFTDASDMFWASILTQVPSKQRRLPIEDQAHEPLCFLSSAFTKASLNWSVPEKEGFAIVQSMCRLDYIICGRTVSIFTDHANLVYLFDPYGKNPGIARHTASKLMRWALKLSAFRYVIEHVPGERNVWADMLTRWAATPKNKVQAPRLPSLKSLMVAPISPGLNSNCDWPTPSVIKLAQQRANSKPGKSFRSTKGLWTNDRGAVWIPPEEKNLQLRILIAAHTGLGGHRGWRTTKATVEAHFKWDSLTKDVEAFVKSCIHSLAAESGAVVPRPLGHALHASERNEIIHFDFCYMMPSDEGPLYVLILKDDFSGFVRLIPAGEADASTAANALLDWFSTFGVVRQWVSDRGTHFKNKLIGLLQSALKSSHHFTLAYCPWSNGTVEVVCRELLRATRALLSEFQLNQRSWPSVLPVVQSVLNNAPLSRLGGRCARTAFMGLPAETPLLCIKKAARGVVTVDSLDELKAKQISEVERLAAALRDMHKDVKQKADGRRAKSVASHNRKTGVRPVNFTTGDFVLRGLLQRERGRKPSLRWKGPYRVTDCRSEYLFEIEDLLTGAKSVAHGRRLKFFRNKDFNVTEEVLNHLSYQENELLVIDQFDDIRRKNGVVELLVCWKGFGPGENNWLSLLSLREDVPVLVEEYLADVHKNGTKRQRKVAATI